MSYMRFLIIGSGGREHALAWKLSQSAAVEHIYVVPGNGGTAKLPKCTNVTNVAPDNFAALVKFAKNNDTNFVSCALHIPVVDRSLP